MADPRDRCARFGTEPLADAELLALIFNQRSLAVPLALLEAHGDLAALSSAEAAELSQTPGVGLVRARQLLAALEAGRRALRCHRPRPRICTADDAYGQLYSEAAGQPRESLWGLYLNRRQVLLAQRRLTTGNDAHTIVDPRQVLRPAVQLGAASVIVAHNHPSGDPEPSAPDLLVTRRLVQAAGLLGIAVLDHIIIGDECYVSLAERGLLPASPAAPQSLSGLR